MNKPNPNDGMQSINAFLRARNMRAGVELAATGEVPVVPSMESVGRYQVGTEIAKGGMGAVLRAKDFNTHRSVAMKVMLPLTGANEENVARFIEEAQITAQLEHPGIVPVYELAVDADDNVYYTMKLVRGVTLKEVIAKLRGRDSETIQAYTLNRLLNAFIKVCETMAYAHAKGVIHRDLKPENIMIGAFGEVMIMDWGIAKVIGIEDEGETTAPDWSTGELAAIPPEDFQKTIEGQVLAERVKSFETAVFGV